MCSWVRDSILHKGRAQVPTACAVSSAHVNGGALFAFIGSWKPAVQVRVPVLILNCPAVSEACAQPCVAVS